MGRHKRITLFDVETTGLVLAKGTDLIHQPHILEIFILLVKEDGVVLDSFHSFFQPPIEIPSFITRLTGIDAYKVRSAPPFKEEKKKIQSLFSDADTIVAHNLSFDLGILDLEMERLGKPPFEKPKEKFCTVEQSLHLCGYRLKLAELYQLATGKTEINNAHQAESDVYALFECFKWLNKGGFRCG